MATCVLYPSALSFQQVLHLAGSETAACDAEHGHSKQQRRPSNIRSCTLLIRFAHMIKMYTVCVQCVCVYVKVKRGVFKVAIFFTCFFLLLAACN